MAERSMKLLEEIHERVIRMETHLESVTDQLNKHDNFLTKECPNQHRYINNTLAQTKVYLVILGAIGSAALVYLVTLGLSKMFQ
jgi:hypothetical protein